jgi:hypothetical protein
VEAKTALLELERMQVTAIIPGDDAPEGARRSGA